MSDLRFTATEVATTAELRALMASRSDAPVLAVADLCLGSWEPQALATQVLAQLLGKELAYRSGARLSSSMSLGDAMSAGIDQEGRGDRLLLTALQMARNIGAALRRRNGRVLVLAPAFGLEWQREDQLLVEYLVQVHPEARLDFAVLAGGAVAWPRDWQVDIRPAAVSDPAMAALPEPIPAGLLARLPGSVPPALRALAGDGEASDLVGLDNGWAVVRPECRRVAHETAVRFSRGEADSLRRGAPRCGAAYALLHAPREEGDCWWLCQEAWRQFDGGYRARAFQFIAAARDCAPDAGTRATFDCHREAMHLACARYAASAAASEPAGDLPAPIRGFLWQAKGWGHVMNDSPALALPCLHEALALREPAEPDVAYLFLLNITALAEVRSGQSDAAHAREKRIEQLIVAHALDDARLQFVNWLNLARLERYAQRLDQAEHYYRLAFSTVEGARTEADSVNANLCMERVEHARGRHRAALLCWVRAALHWCASDCPEALGWRLQSLILGRRQPVEVASLAEARGRVAAIAQAMLDKLRDASLACGIDIQPVGGTPPSFHDLDGATGRVAPSRCLGGAGWAVVCASAGSPPRPGAERGASFQALRAWLGGWVRQGVVDDSPAYFIDRRLGGEMPTDQAGMVASAIDHALTDLVYEGRPVELPGDEYRSLRQRRSLRRNPIVSSIDADADKTVIRYKRYLAPYTLSPEERVVLQASNQRANLAELTAQLGAAQWSAEQVARTVDALEKRRVVRVSSAFDTV